MVVRQLWQNYGSQDYKPYAQNEFAKVADGWLIAYVKLNPSTVLVTHEKNKVTKKKVPIPNVCDAFGVPYIDTYEMMRRLKIVL